MRDHPDHLEGKTRQELFERCREVGVSASSSDTNEELRRKLLEPVPEPVPEPEPKKPIGQLIPEGQLMALDGTKISGKKFRVKIFSTDTDKTDVKLSVNGFGVQIKRDVEVILDECFVDVLNHSMIYTYEHDEEGRARPVMKITYPHQAVQI